MVIAYKMFKHRDFRSLRRPAMKLESGPLGSLNEHYDKSSSPSGRLPVAEADRIVTAL